MWGKSVSRILDKGTSIIGFNQICGADLTWNGWGITTALVLPTAELCQGEHNTNWALNLLAFPQYFQCNLGPRKYMGQHICPGQAWKSMAWVNFSVHRVEKTQTISSLMARNPLGGPSGSLLHPQWKAHADLSEHRTRSPSYRTLQRVQLGCYPVKPDAMPFRGARGEVGSQLG